MISGTQIVHIMVKILKAHKLTEDVADTVFDWIQFLYSNGLDENFNPYIWEQELLDHFQLLESKGKKINKLRLLTLLACYKRPYKSSELPGSQHAKHIEELRKLGFVFRKSDEYRHDFKIKDNLYREIIGISGNIVKVVRDCPKAKKMFVKDKICPITNSHTDLQIDHRMPRSRYEELGMEPPVLTVEMVESGEADQYFVALSRSMNCKKREVCKRCDGELDLWETIPSVVNKEEYVRHRPESTCDGCFWHNFG